MAAPALGRLLPTAARLATRRVVVPQTSVKLASCPSTYGPRRFFSARSSLQVKKYTEDHEWIELDTDGKTGTIGITEYAAKALGEVVYVELPETGMEVSKGDTIGAVESVKSASDIMSPVSGTVVEANGVLEATPKTINNSPESEGWIAKIEMTDLLELDSLMSKEDYDKFEKE